MLLDNIKDSFIHYQLIHFCQATRLQYVNGQITLANQNVLQLQQQHVDHHITLALLKKGTRDNYKTWNQQDSAWVDMLLHESHDEGSFSVSNNTITCHTASYMLDQHQVCCLPGHLCPSSSASLAARQRPPGHQLGCPPPLHAHAFALGPLAAVRLHQAVGSGTARAAVRRRMWRCCQRGRTPAASPRLLGASSSSRNSTVFIWHSSGVRCPPRCLPALRTSSHSISRSLSSLPSAVSWSSSSRIGSP